MIDFVQVGKKITHLRKNMKMSQEDLANKLYVTRQCLSKWELGISIPSIEMLIELSKILNVSIDEILCLDEVNEIDEKNIFKGHERNFIIKKLINNELDLSIPDIFYQLSPSERMLVLKKIKEGGTKCDLDELSCKLTKLELRFIGGNENEA